MRKAWQFVGLLPLLLAPLAVPACSNMAEGERCDTKGENGGNDDCLDGLQCTKKEDLGTSADLCCPPDRSKATAAACRLPPAPPGGDASIPPLPDGGPDVVVTEAGGDAGDAGGDGGNDGGGDDAGDGSSDAPSEGG